jgi:ATPase subunit of ABC transporter with duplicated ATPase domains
MLPDRNKKTFLNEGRAVGGNFFNYGGFPKIKNLELQEESEDPEKAFYARMDALRTKMEPLQRAKRHKKATPEQLSTLSELEKKYKEELASRPKREGKKERIEFHPDSQTGHGAPGSGSRYTGD